MTPVAELHLELVRRGEAPWRGTDAAAAWGEGDTLDTPGPLA